MSVLASEIPTVDLNDIRSGDAARLASAAQAIAKAFGTYGLIYIRNAELTSMDALYDRFAAFCAKPDAEKQKYNRSDLWYQRGWTPPNTEKAVIAEGQPDFKECWFAAPMAMPERLRALFPELYCENVWPAGDADFAEQYLASGRAIHATGELLLKGCETALNLAQGTLTNLAQGGPHVYRLLRYLPLTAAQTEEKILWGEEHTDFNLLTLLPGGRFHDPNGHVAKAPDDGCGLYLRTRGSKENPHGTMVRGTPPAGCMVAQVGQQLEILTGGKFLATPHVVTAPRTPGWSRFSAAHFMHIQSDALLFPLPQFQNPETIADYAPPVLAGTYARKTLVDIGLAPASALSKLGYRHYERLAETRA